LPRDWLPLTVPMWETEPMSTAQLPRAVTLATLA
jgi:hypothetical protein